MPVCGPGQQSLEARLPHLHVGTLLERSPWKGQARHPPPTLLCGPTQTLRSVHPARTDCRPHLRQSAEAEEQAVAQGRATRVPAFAQLEAEPPG